MAGFPEILGRSSFYGAPTPTDDCDSADEPDDVDLSDWHLCNTARTKDIKLLKTLNVDTIADFMVENSKVKFGLK